MFQRIGAWIITVVCGALLAACASAAEPSSAPSPGSSVAASAATTWQAGDPYFVAPVPVTATTPQDAPIAAQWNELLEHGDFKQVMETYALVPKLETSNGDVKADACKAHADTLEGALKINPVSMALWYDAYRCAKALGHSDLAEQRLQSFTNVVGFAMRSTPPDWGETPIRVLHFDDIVAFIQASGQRLVNMYVDRAGGSRYLPVTVVLLDTTTHRQRILTFDFLDSAMRMQRDPNAEFPLFRNAMASGILATLAKSGVPPFVKALRLQDALGKDDLKSRIETLQSQAGQGSFIAALTLARICLFDGSNHCAGQAIDALLPWAEKHDACAMVWLAMGYADGNGVRTDSGKARRLIEAGDRELGNVQAAYLFASLREGHGLQVDSPARKILEAKARAHEPHAEFVVAETAVNAPLAAPLSPAVRTYLRHAAEAGLPEARRLLAEELFNEHDEVEALGWLLKAADMDDARAQQEMANHYAEEANKDKTGERTTENRKLWREWNARAAQDGNVNVMLGLGNFYMGLPPTKESLFQAQGWLQSAAAAGNTNAALSLADIYARNTPELDGSASKAAQIYQSVMDTEPDNPNARLGLAELLISGNGVPKDLAKARRLRIEAAKSGNAAAEYVLGKDLLNGESGPKDPKAGIAWLEKSIAQGYAMAEVRYADALFQGDGVERDVKAAIRLWQSSFEHDTWMGINDGAWYLCTTSDPELLDGARGLQFANELAKAAGIGAAELDTIAACHGAVNDFHGAIDFEKNAIQQAEQMQPRPSKMIDALQKREQLYEQHKPYTEPLS